MDSTFYDLPYWYKDSIIQLRQLCKYRPLIE